MCKQDMTSPPQHYKSADGWFQLLLFIVTHPPTFLGDFSLLGSHLCSSPLQKLLSILPRDFYLMTDGMYCITIERPTCGIESQLLTDDFCILSAPSVVADCSPLSIDADLNATLGLDLPTHQTNVSRLTFKTRVGHCMWSWGACAYYYYEQNQHG